MTVCSICGGDPVGEGCFQMCPHSPCYYSPERERQDDATDDGSDDVRERFAAERADMELEADRADEADPDLRGRETNR